MSEYDDLFNESQEETPLIKKLRSIIEEQGSTLKETQKELNEVRGAQREQTLSATLAEKGLSPKVAKFIPQDADVDQWLEENGDVFGAPKPPPEPVAPSEGEVKMGRLGEENEQTMTVPADIEARLKAATSQQEVKEILGQLG